VSDRHHRIPRRQRRRVTACFWLVLGLSACSSDSGPPHIVLIVLDTLRADRLGSYGFELEVSPELDRLGEQGVRLVNAISQSPWTRPSIASILTSQHPRTLGIYSERAEILADRFETLAEVLQNAGYRTLGSTANPNVNPAFNFHQGFDEYWGTDQVWDWMVPESGQEQSPEPSLPPGKQQLTRILAARDAESADQQGRPHYVQLTLMDIHQADAKPDLIRPSIRELYAEVEPPVDRHYLWGVRQLSQDVAEFVEAWGAAPGFEDTLFVIVSDHGQGLSSHPDVKGWQKEHHGFYLFESQLRVPWILYHPGDRLPSGLTIEQPVRLLELMPTVLEIAGVPAPTGMAGEVLVLAPDAPQPVPEAFVIETQFRGRNKIGLYSEHWKYFENRDGEPGLNRRELHPQGVMENGMTSDVGARHPQLMRQFSAEIETWERRHPRTGPSVRDSLTSMEEQQLRALGYLE